jgi:hypothetical protein
MSGDAEFFSIFEARVEWEKQRRERDRVIMGEKGENV